MTNETFNPENCEVEDLRAYYHPTIENPLDLVFSTPRIQGLETELRNKIIETYGSDFQLIEFTGTLSVGTFIGYRPSAICATVGGIDPFDRDAGVPFGTFVIASCIVRNFYTPYTGSWEVRGVAKNTQLAPIVDLYKEYSKDVTSVTAGTDPYATSAFYWAAPKRFRDGTEFSEVKREVLALCDYDEKGATIRGEKWTVQLRVDPSHIYNTNWKWEVVIIANDGEITIPTYIATDAQDAIDKFVTVVESIY